MFCPKCGNEFVAGITTCPDCAVALVAEPPAKGPPELAEGEEFVTVATFENAFDASIARGALEAAGMDVFVPRELDGAFARLSQPEIWPELKVRERDRDRAVELLKQAGHR